MTPETARFLLQLLDAVSLSARDPELVTKAQAVETARAELTEVVEP